MLRGKAVYKHPLFHDKGMRLRRVFPEWARSQILTSEGLFELEGLWGPGFLLTAMAECSDVWCPLDLFLSSNKGGEMWPDSESSLWVSEGGCPLPPVDLSLKDSEAPA